MVCCAAHPDGVDAHRRCAIPRSDLGPDECLERAHDPAGKEGGGDERELGEDGGADGLAGGGGRERGAEAWVQGGCLRRGAAGSGLVTSAEKYTHLEALY